RFSHGSSPHLAAALATFQRGETYNIIFEWAEGGNLRYFWRTNQPSRQPKLDLVRWVAQQSIGLAGALEMIHKSTREESGIRKSLKPTIEFGRHGDIKPENILNFNGFKSPNGLGNLAIADFGLTAFKTSTRGHYRDQGHTPTYRAPEYDLNRGVTTQAYDIWSLGCLYLEFVTWILTGSYGDVKFTEARTTKGIKDLPDDSYFVVNRGDAAGASRAEIKSSWIAKLRQHPNCSPFLQRLLDIIVNGMLVVDVENRIEASECASALAEAASLIETDSPGQTQNLEPTTVTREPGSEIQREGKGVRLSRSNCSVSSILMVVG
ncbi:kinase-like protein, partial [Colletotrichum falcatum]